MASVEAPLRLPGLARMMGWFPAFITLVPVACYTIFVLAPWLVYFAAHGTGACTVDTGCAGPAKLAVEFPGAVWDPLNWPLYVVAVLTMFVLLASPVAPLALAGMAVAHGLVTRRIPTLVGGGLMLALGVFQLTPTGRMLTTWLLD